MESFYNLENAYYGTTISPTQGGTNNSEFELLASNSTYLMQNSAPYNYFALKGEQDYRKELFEFE